VTGLLTKTESTAP